MKQLNKNQSATDFIGDVNSNLLEMDAEAEVSVSMSADGLVNALNTAFAGVDGRVVLSKDADAETFVGGLNTDFGLAGQEEPPTPAESDLWIPPTQEASSRGKYSYDGIIDAYDNLMNNSSYPGTITKNTYSEQAVYDMGNYGGTAGDIRRYNLYSYVFTPPSYRKTFYVQAGIHGNEKDAPQTVLRIMDIICNHTGETAYSRLRELRDNVRFVVIPVVSPHGFSVGDMKIPYVDVDGETYHYDRTGNNTDSMNPNRNFDCNFATGIEGGRGGEIPFQVPETRHVKHVVESIGAKNIDYMFDNHDGGDVEKHFWFNYNMDGQNAVMARKLLADLISEEERLRLAGGTDYRRPNSDDADEYGYIHPNVADSSGYSTGTTSSWGNCTLGCLASGPEYIGGIFGYTFSSEQMTRSLRIRANIMIYAYEMLDTKGWQINEPADAQYFHFDYPLSMTRQGLRLSLTGTETKVTPEHVAQRWDSLATNNPSYVSKSAKLGTNVDGNDIYSYTLGIGSNRKKVLFVGGSLRSAQTNITEFGMYVLAEYLCDDYMVNQSSFLRKLKQNYTIIVVPFFDFYPAGNGSDIQRGRGLNTTCFSATAKWVVLNGQCAVNTSARYDNSNRDMFITFIEDNDDAIALFSGAEIITGSEKPVGQYSTEYMTQFVLPKNQGEPQWLEQYCSHLEDRGEDTPVVEHTDGRTFGDYAFDNYNVPTYYVNLQVSNKWEERKQYAQAQDDSGRYMYRNYETGRRIANIANMFLMVGGDIDTSNSESND